MQHIYAYKEYGNMNRYAQTVFSNLPIPPTSKHVVDGWYTIGYSKSNTYHIPHKDNSYVYFTQTYRSKPINKRRHISHQQKKDDIIKETNQHKFNAITK